MWKAVLKIIREPLSPPLQKDVIQYLRGIRVNSSLPGEGLPSLDRYVYPLVFYLFVFKLIKREEMYRAILGCLAIWQELDIGQGELPLPAFEQGFLCYSQSCPT